jgi:hypothetical protein
MSPTTTPKASAQTASPIENFAISGCNTAASGLNPFSCSYGADALEVTPSTRASRFFEGPAAGLGRLPLIFQQLPRWRHRPGMDWIAVLRHGAILRTACRAVRSATDTRQRMLPLHSFLALTVISLLCTLGHVSAAQAANDPDLTVSEKELAETYFKDCMKDWDDATHMTRKDWERTCRRVTNDRARFRMQQQLDQRTKQN